MKLAREIAKKLSDSGVATADKFHGCPMADFNQEKAASIIAEKLEPIREALKLCEWEAVEQLGWDIWRNVCPDCRNTKQDGHADNCCDIATALSMLEEEK